LNTSKKWQFCINLQRSKSLLNISRPVLNQVLWQKVCSKFRKFINIYLFEYESCFFAFGCWFLDLILFTVLTQNIMLNYKYFYIGKSNKIRTLNYLVYNSNVNFVLFDIYLHVRGFSFWSFFVISFPAYLLTLAVTYIWAFKLRPCERWNFPNFLFSQVLEIFRKYLVFLNSQKFHKNSLEISSCFWVKNRGFRSFRIISNSLFCFI